MINKNNLDKYKDFSPSVIGLTNTITFYPLANKYNKAVFVNNNFLGFYRVCTYLKKKCGFVESS